jgi:hypothetical protein
MFCKDGLKRRRAELQQALRQLDKEETVVDNIFYSAVEREAAMFFREQCVCVEKVSVFRDEIYSPYWFVCKGGFSISVRGSLIFDIHRNNTVLVYNGSGTQPQVSHNSFETGHYLAGPLLSQWKEHAKAIDRNTLSSAFQSRVLHWISKELPGSCWADVIEGNLIKMI